MREQDVKTGSKESLLCEDLYFLLDKNSFILLQRRIIYIISFHNLRSVPKAW